MQGKKTNKQKENKRQTENKTKRKKTINSMWFLCALFDLMKVPLVM